MSRQQKLLELMAVTFRTEQDFAAQMVALEGDNPSAPDDWSAKDNLAHVAHWQEHLADNLQAIRQGKLPQRVEQIHPANDTAYQAHRADTWEQVQEFLENSYQRLVQDTRGFSQAELDSCDFFPWHSNRPLWRTIAGYAILHPYSHLAGVAGKHDLAGSILESYQAIQADLLALDDDPAWQGLVYYDLACFCALAGEKPGALQALAAAFRLAPDLREWSQQDSDLDSLRADPTYQAMLSPTTPTSN